MTNGDQYSGEFVNDFIHGEGFYITRNFEKVEGLWIKNKFQRRE